MEENINSRECHGLKKSKVLQGNERVSRFAQLTKALATTPDDFDKFSPQNPHDGKKELIAPQGVYHVVCATLHVQAYTHNK